MSTTGTSTVAPVHLRHDEHDDVPKSLKNLTGDVLDESAIGWLRETPVTTPIEEMRKRYLDDGYVFLKDLIPRNDVLDVREEYFSHFASLGFLKPGTSPREGIWNPASNKDDLRGIGSPDMTNKDTAMNSLIEAHKAPKYLELLNHPTLRDMIQRFMDWDRVILLRRNLLRHSLPGAGSTGIHYDKLFLRVGKDEFLTAWIPLGDIKPSGGGLMYFEQSSGIGQETEAEFTERNANLPPEERINAFNINMANGGKFITGDAVTYQREHGPGRRWLVANYEAGDVVFHNPWMVHCASMNMSEVGSIRLSADVRYVEEGSDFDHRWNQAYWHPEDGL